MSKDNKQRISAEQLNEMMPPVMPEVYGAEFSDSAGREVTGGAVSSEYMQATTSTMGPSSIDIIAASGQGTSPFQHEGDVLAYNSVGHVESQNIAYTEQRANEMRGFGEVASALVSTGIQQFANPQYKEELKSIAARAANLPRVDTVTNVEGQRIILEPQVSAVPALFNTKKLREDSLKDLRMLLGSQEKTIEVCKWARSAGIQFVALPCLWLSQQLALESKKNKMYDDMPKDLQYDPTSDGDNADVPRLIAALFSAPTARNIQMIARIHRVSTLSVFRYLVKKVCEVRQAQVVPEHGEQSEFNDLLPQIQIPA
jgi:hypothetical protein